MPIPEISPANARYLLAPDFKNIPALHTFFSPPIYLQGAVY
jgi:hypothetical protein